MKAALPILMLAPLALSACSEGEPREIPPPSPAAEIIGAARDCVPITQLTSSKIRDDRTIDFFGPGSKVWRVTLPNTCGGLRAADSFTYETSLSQLCQTDIIYPLNQYGGQLQRGAGCGMGPFVPVKLAR